MCGLVLHMIFVVTSLVAYLWRFNEIDSVIFDIDAKLGSGAPKLFKWKMVIKSQKKLIERFAKITKKLDAFAKMAMLNECTLGEVFRKKIGGRRVQRVATHASLRWDGSWSGARSNFPVPWLTVTRWYITRRARVALLCTRPVMVQGQE